MRKCFALLLVLHGLAHASAGMWITNFADKLVTAVLWEGAALGFILAAGGMLGFAALSRHVMALTGIAVVCSFLVLLSFPHTVFMPGLALDILILALIISSWDEYRSVPRMRRIPETLFSVFALYTAAIIGARHWMTTWGSTITEREQELIGDTRSPATYRIDHAVTINAPADSVWPWLAQIGQDRGGFYSYDWLERAFGDRIHNANRIVAEWQERKVGDTVRAIQRGYLGGLLDRNPGWIIKEIVPGRTLVLEGWGAFVVEPIDDHRARLHVRTRGYASPSFATLALAPMSLLAFEPAHFIMERRMLLGIKERAEGALREASRIDGP